MLYALGGLVDGSAAPPRAVSNVRCPDGHHAYFSSRWVSVAAKGACGVIIDAVRAGPFESTRISWNEAG